jgi:hypothetical protein
VLLVRLEGLAAQVEEELGRLLDPLLLVLELQDKETLEVLDILEAQQVILMAVAVERVKLALQEMVVQEEMEVMVLLRP